MSDRHVRILAMLARRSQRQLDAQGPVSSTEDVAAVQQRVNLRLRAARTRARLAAARARRY
jgi:hypothetical protein